MTADPSATFSTHTRTSTGGHGPDFCAECSGAANEWVQWPCILPRWPEDDRSDLAPQGRWTVDNDGDPVWQDANGVLDLRDINAPDTPYNSAVAARAAFADLVRRANQPDPTAEQVAARRWGRIHPRGSL
jgi:hypothetical protein